MESLGLVAYGFFAVGATFMLKKWHGESAKTFSQNAARERSSIYYYAGMMTIFLALLSLFVYLWFIPALHLPVAFGLVFGVGVVGELVAVMVPEIAGTKKAAVHVVAAGVMYVATLVLVGILAAQPGLPGAVRVGAGVAFGLMALLFAAAIFFKRSRRHSLAMQIVHLVTFIAVLLLATYVR